MKIIIVGFSHSVHTARWINQILDQGWEICLFPSNDDGAISAELGGVKVYHSFYAKKYNKNKNVEIHGILVFNYLLAYILRLIARKLNKNYRKKQLTKLIGTFQPDIIHSMEIQSGGYLVNDIKKSWEGKFPKWIVTNWGSDIYYFGRFIEHKRKIKEVLANCDYYSCECSRDICLSKDFGFKGKTLPVFPNSGGYDLKKAKKLRKIPISKRKIIMVKGYQHFAGRALIALEALTLAKKYLAGYKVVVYSIQKKSGVEEACELFFKKTGVSVEIVPLNTPHERMLVLYGRSRVAIGLSISDAISTMVLESMVTGCFPIQSETSCANEWIKNGKTGFIVSPEDPIIVAKAIKRALLDDKLVNDAARVNWQTARKRLDYKIIKKKTLEFYKTVLKDAKN